MERKKTMTTTTMMTAMLSYMSRDMKNDNGCGICFWTMSVYIETLDADYEDVDSLNNLDADNIMRCGYHYTNCALQNVFKLFNWWSDNHK
ncbi:hypothetical protein P5V15_005719 [Pogonomyrmex californicus]